MLRAYYNKASRHATWPGPADVCRSTIHDIDYTDLRRSFGAIDIYLFDQLLRGNLTPDMRVLDAGCGNGRNLGPLLRLGFEACATDEDPRAVDAGRRLAATLAPRLPKDSFRVEPIERCSFGDGAFDAVVSSAVLHFARDDAHFTAMVDEMWRVLGRGGILFCRLASTIGMADRMRGIEGRRFLLPDGSERYLVDEEHLMTLTARVGGSLIDPLKTTVVQDQRCMTTWVLRKMG
jgi:SAM-dependent methyltransferase